MGRLLNTLLGLPNAQPSRGRPDFGYDSNRNQVSEWVGGARGPAALPSELTSRFPIPPAVVLAGARGTVSQHRGAFVENAAAPRLCYDGELGHNDLPWSRPVYQNLQGLLEFIPPTHMPSWTADTPGMPPGPTVPIPSQRKQIANFMVREEFGSTRELFPGKSLGPFVARLPKGTFQQGRRWMRQAKTQQPTLLNQSVYGTAGSYGQTTAVLPTGPSNVPGSPSPYGAY